jgi:hypothetical protein
VPPVAQLISACARLSKVILKTLAESATGVVKVAVNDVLEFVETVNPVPQIPAE